MAHNQAHRRGVHLTAQELRVVRLLALGLCAKEVGVHLGISVNSVRTHIESVYGLLDVSTHEEVYDRLGWLSVPTAEDIEAKIASL